MNLDKKKRNIDSKYSNIIIHIPSQTLKLYTRTYWENLLIDMLMNLEKHANYVFQNPKLDLYLVNDKEISIYNEKHMNCIGPTNILSFPTLEQNGIENNNKQNTHNPFMQYIDTFNKDTTNKEQKIYRTDLGVLILSINTLEREARLFGQNTQVHAIRLLAHGLIHLLDFDHGEEMQELTDLLEEKTSRQENILEKHLETFIPFWSYYHG